MKIGQLDRRVTIQRLDGERNSFGELEGDWVDVATVWGKIDLPRGGEAVGESRASSKVTGVVTLRYGADVRPSDRLSIANESGGEAFSVLAVREMGRRDGLYLDVERVEGRTNAVSTE